MVELCANGSVLVVEPSIRPNSSTATNRPNGIKGRLYVFAMKHLTECRGLTYGELEGKVRNITYSHRKSLPYPPDRATQKILSRWQEVDEDGYFVIRPSFAYCS